ncbi:hypothetical protein CWO85_03495 [Candidatus Phytoplasma ziziphi]|uniref:Antitoxin SocA-like Panacea domain-containing protein n=1 Tax=Ziziphus jujuba witches'-broom phytoplasma TaxID=135727 RepID=A0A660HNE3_ZIZJU|nr:type II toxin-antitoxin system antitoxin SocA domain-containing protein [Candidatus Phytoplasma ziziphi]AYJ01535.1 hypothetical protein CWO85_03495 [Candidatus Phytoplasma ziziphi]
MEQKNNNDEINVFDIAKYFLNKDSSINKTKLQKLLYYSQGYFLAKYNTVLFNETIEAWIYGPVIPVIYAEILFQETMKPNTNLNFDKSATNKNLTKEQKEILEQIYDEFYGLNSKELSKKTHEEDPWKTVYDPNKSWSECVITPKILYNYFSKRK